MTFIFDLPNEQLIPATFGLAEKIEAFLDVVKPREIQQAAKEGESTKDAAKRNLLALARRACVEHPAETAALSDAFWKLEEGETAPNAVITFNKVVGRGDVMNFFASLAALV